MSRLNVFDNVHTSLILFVQDTIRELTIPNHPMAFINLDAYANDDNLPKGDLMGFAGLSIEASQQAVDITFMIGFIVENDENLFRLRKNIGVLFKKLMPEQRIGIMDAEDKTFLGQMNVFDGTRIMPVAGKAGRPYQLIRVNAGTSLGYES
ncbi:hypothetical protein Lumi_016 [Xylophilus phage Lumi]|nr:hypothetical protein Lumi_016 [Xylophilus phage Lumi]